MFDALQASPLPGARRSRAVLGAVLSHILVIGVAARGTAIPPAIMPEVPRDTIRFHMTAMEPDHRGEPPSNDILPDAPQVPAIPLDAPEFQPPTLSFSVSGPNQSSPLVSLRNTDVVPAAIDSSRRIINSTEVDEPPKLIGELHPRYPRGLERAGVTGVVRVEYVVGTTGRMDARSVRVLASTHPGFVLAALAALGDARFRPARRNGRPSAVLVQQTIRFRHR